MFLKCSISVAPEIFEYSMEPSSIEVREGSRVELVCNATGVPMPVVSWYKGSKPLTDITDSIMGMF